MSLDSDIRILSEVALFDGFGNEQLRLLAFGAERCSYKTGDTIFHRGAIADGGYVIVDGTVEITADSEPQAKILGRFGRSSLIGELAIISESHRRVSAFARSQVELIRITRILFRRMLEEFPELASQLHKKISVSNHQFISQLEQVRRNLDRSG